MPSFVGRSAELATLRSALTDAQKGRGRLALLVGEPGIGKTRLADELSAEAGERARVLWGRCWEVGGAPAFWPWIEILRPLIAEYPAEALAADLAAEAASVAMILPELRSRLPGLPPAAPIEAEHARFLLFDALARLLRGIASQRPLVLVLDDLHAADEPSLRLLEFVARGLRGSHLLVIGTYREADAKLVPGRSELLASIGRDAERIALRRLGSDEVAELIQAISGVAPAAQVVAAVQRVSEGTPLFVNEVARLVAEQGHHAISASAASGGGVVVPDGLGPAIRGHLARVSDPTRAVLRAAAVIGRDFSAALLESVLRAENLPSDELGDRLLEAERAGLIADLRAAPARFRFSNILVREIIYQDLGAKGRERLHGQVARALMAAVSSPERASASSAELAHHFLSAGPDLRAQGAAHARRAGEHALAAYAHEQALAHFRQALDASSAGSGEPSRSRVELLLAIADAHLRGGDRGGVNATSEQAAEEARELGEWQLFAQAALRRGAEFTFGVVDPRLVGLLETALAELGSDSPLYARVMARLAAARQPAPDPEEPLAMARQAIALARESGDRSALAAVLRDARAAYLPMDSLEERTALDLEALALAYETGDQRAALHAQRRLAGNRLEEGQLVAALGHVEQFELIADQMREPHQKWWSLLARATAKVIVGAFAEAEGMLAELERAAGEDGDVIARNFLGVQRLVLCRTARRDEELARIDEELARVAARFDTPNVHFYRAVVRCNMKDVEYVRGARNVLSYMHDHPRFAGQGHYGEMAVLIGDRAIIELCYARLLPWAKHYAAAVAYDGAHARTLGILAHALGRTEEARAHFENALALEERMGARPWLAHALLAYAKMLRTTGNDRDRAKAAELLARAAEIARELDMPGMVAEIGSDVAIESAAEARSIDLAQSFRLEGEYWTVNFGGQWFRLKDNKGLQLVAYLIENPDREFHVLHLVNIADKQPGASALIQSAVPVGPDASARAAYKEKLEDLQSELEEAERYGDAGRTLRLREQIELLSDEIGRGLGLGGRERGSGSSVERARVNVQRRISDALKRIESACPELGRHLARSIRTGTYCKYATS